MVKTIHVERFTTGQRLMLYTSIDMVYDVARIHIAKKTIFIMWNVYNVAG
jgi:hypothetical protein